MDLVRLFDHLLPRHCAGCGAPATIWCDTCAGSLAGLFAVERTATLKAPPVLALAPYSGAPRRAVLAFKERGRRALAPALGRALAAALPPLADRVPALAAAVPAVLANAAALTFAHLRPSPVPPGPTPGPSPSRSPSPPQPPPGAPDTRAAGTRQELSTGPPPAGTLWLVPAPSRALASRKRGGHHMARVAAQVAGHLAAHGVPAAVAPALRLTRRAEDSVGLAPAARVANLARHLSVDPAGVPPPGAPALLIDDVVTTGATVAACADVLERAGVTVLAVLALTAVR